MKSRPLTWLMAIMLSATAEVTALLQLFLIGWMPRAFLRHVRRNYRAKKQNKKQNKTKEKRKEDLATGIL